MKSTFTLLTLLTLLLTACAAPNETPDIAANATESTQPETNDKPSNPDSEVPKQARSDRTKKVDKPKGIAHFELNETFQNLLDKVNAAHETVKMCDRDYKQYYVKNDEPGFIIQEYTIPLSMFWDGPPHLPSPSVTTVLTLEQVKEDIEICYKALRTKYGRYEYFGGDEVFRPASAI